MKGLGTIGPRLGIAIVAAIFACFAIAPYWSVDAQSPRALPGPVDDVYADPANLMFKYGPSEIERGGLQAASAFTANITVTYDSGFVANAQARAAFQAAVDIWRSVISSPAPIRVNASFQNLGPNVLGSAGPTRICSTSHGLPNTWYAAALADKLNGSAFCATLAGATSEITANFSSSRADWDFGTSGTPVSGKYSFLTVALHELGHGLGFYGSMTASLGVGSFGYDTPFVDIFDRFAVTGAGAALIAFVNPSAALGAQLVSNNTFFNGSNATINNGGLRPKLETHNFTTAYGVSSDNGFREGSSYSHVDDVLYTGTPNGLMTWALAQAEVYTDPGPIVRGMFVDMGWTVTNSCVYSLSSASFTTDARSAASSVNVSTGSGCGWTAVSNTSWLAVTSGGSGTGNGTVSYTVGANSGGTRTGTLTIAGQAFVVTQAAYEAMPGDYDGDGRGDVTVYRPSTGTWFILKSTTSYTTWNVHDWGEPGDLPMPGDYDGDGRTDATVYRPSTGTWFILKSSTNYTLYDVYDWGEPGDMPLPGDYDGDGKTDPTVYRPSTGTWFILKSTTSYTTWNVYEWGEPGDMPMPGDYDGDGRTDATVYRPSTGTWFILKSSTSYTLYDVYDWGEPGDMSLPGDYDGDGRTDATVYRPSTGTWFILKSSTNYTLFDIYDWGEPGDRPLPGDYDGDGRTDVAVYRPSDGTWFILKSSTNYTVYNVYDWGETGDTPVF